VPLPISVWKVTVPSMASGMRFTTDSPKPCPLDFVVTSGLVSKSKDKSDGIPSCHGLLSFLFLFQGLYVAEYCHCLLV